MTNNAYDYIDQEFMPACEKWISNEIANLTDKLSIKSPSAWAEENRYLPASVSPLPGHYSYEVCPPLKEIVDCLDIRSPVREVTLMKGAQIGATVGVLENAIGYFISEVKSAPMMLLTADAELAKTRMDGHVTLMIQQSGLADKIMTSDELSKNKTGKTNSKIEWEGGGYILPFGARNAAKLRSNPIQVLLEDEIDGYPEIVGKDGDPMKLAEARTKAYTQTRKIVRLSTPLIKGASRIERCFLEGDQRRYHVPCKKCGQFQELKFSGVNKETGEVWGLTWKTDENDILIPDTVRYICKFCSHQHTNSDKIWMLPRGKWVATAKSKSRAVRSYHLNALYSPAAMYPWEEAVQDWLSAWDVHKERPKDLGLLQEFYNNVLGKTFELRGSKLKYTVIASHKRGYKYGDIPNTYAIEHSQSKILALTCTVDVHKDNLAVAIFGWCRSSRCYLIDYWEFKGDTSQLDDETTWGRLATLVEGDGYVADDGSLYKIALTLIDSGFSTDLVYRFCEQYETSVYPIKGREFPPKNAAVKEFSPFATPFGTTGYGITVNFYKDRMSAVLNRRWDGVGVQSDRAVNFPTNISDANLKELTVEQKREKINSITKQREGFEWFRPSGVKNELWDLLIYSAAAIDLIALDVCRNTLGLDHVNWVAFWDTLEAEKLFFIDV